MNGRMVLFALTQGVTLLSPCLAGIPDPISLDGTWHFKWVKDAKAADTV
jgi:hypothetical protein